jgi:hypothetical protein
MSLNRAIELLEGAEKAIAELASRATAQRDYPQASTLITVAQRVASIRQSPLFAAATGDGQAGNGAHTAPAQPPPGAGPRVMRALGGHAYPRFKREGDSTLVKVGWSKSDRSTYEHRSDKQVLEKVVDALVLAAKPGELFTSEAFLPLKDGDGTELPTYQCYLCLAWLVAIRVVERHGRKGYTVDNPEQLRQMAEEAWQALPRR